MFTTKCLLYATPPPLSPYRYQNFRERLNIQILDSRRITHKTADNLNKYQTQMPLDKDNVFGVWHIIMLIRMF